MKTTRKPKPARQRAISKKPRCWWCGTDPLYVRYHDDEWGRPVRTDGMHFEHLVLEGFQAGLSWITILKKRENFRKAFRQFDPKKVSRFTKADVNRLLKDSGIVRHRGKIEAAITNARAFLEVQKEFGSFAKYIWAFSNNKIVRRPRGATRQSLPARTELSDAIAKDLKKRGFKFVGSTTMYAHLQATGIVDDHVRGCFRYRKSR